MNYVVDSSIWIDFFRAASPVALKQQAAKFIEDENAMICEPVLFELLRAAPAASRKNLQAHLDLLPVAPTPSMLWRDAAVLGQKCLARGAVPPAMDLLIAQVCLDSDLALLTFDQHFVLIARVGGLKVTLLDRVAE